MALRETWDEPATFEPAGYEPANGDVLPGPQAFRAALEAERAARVNAERTAERLAMAVAREHRLRQHAEAGARAALAELELARGNRYLMVGTPPRERRWRRLRRLRRALLH